jgi:hypothetical protein
VVSVFVPQLYFGTKPTIRDLPTALAGLPKDEAHSASCSKVAEEDGSGGKKIFIDKRIKA